MNTSKHLFIVNNKSGWAVVSANIASAEGQPRDDSGQFEPGVVVVEEVRIRDCRMARFSRIETAVEAVMNLIDKAQPDVVSFVPATRAGERVFQEAWDALESPAELNIRRSIQTAELDADSLSPFALAWKLARKAWFNDNVEIADTWYSR